LTAAEEVPVRSTNHRTWTLVTLGLAVRLVGVGLIWLGDGHESVFRKSLVVSGVVLTVGGITVLRYLLLSPLLSKLLPLRARRITDENMRHL